MSHKIRIRAEGAKVFIGVNDRLWMEIGPQEAREFANAIRQAALAAEEYEQHERLILEGAMCARAGLPLTLSNHPKILDEVAKEAAWNGDLRRYMPGGVKATERVGVPSVIQHPKKEKAA